MAKRFGRIPTGTIPLSSLLAAAVVAGIVGYLIGINPASKTATPAGQATAPSVEQNLNVGPERVIKSAQAQAAGTITKFDQDMVTVQSDKGELASFKLAPQFSIYSIASNSATPPKPSQDKTDIKTGQRAFINLVWQGSEFLVQGISYLPTETPQSSAAVKK